MSRLDLTGVPSEPKCMVHRATTTVDVDYIKNKRNSKI